MNSLTSFKLHNIYVPGKLVIKWISEMTKVINLNIYFSGGEWTNFKVWKKWFKIVLKSMNVGFYVDRRDFLIFQSNSIAFTK